MGDTNAVTAVHTVVLIPYRDTDPRQRRGAQLGAFSVRAPAVFDAAWGAGLWAVLVVQQQPCDGRLFCRGRLLNAGAWLVQGLFPHARHLVLHDVDMVMDAERARAAVEPALRHGELRALNTDSKWYRTAALYTGGVCSLRCDTFWDANGFQNTFEGWGGEDDCLRDSVRALPGGKITRSTAGTMVDVEETDYRCATDPAAKMPPAAKREAKAKAIAEGFAVTGAKQLVFAVMGTGVPVPGFHIVTVDVFVGDLPPGWTMHMSKTHKVPYYYHAVSRKTQYHMPKA